MDIEKVKKPPKLGPHEYGTKPNFKQLEKFVRDSRIYEELPAMEDILKAEDALPGRKVVFIIRLFPQILLLFSLLLAFYTFYTALTSSNGYGLNYKLIDNYFFGGSNVSDPALYNFKASTAVAYQVIALRGGQRGQNYNMTVTLPYASDMIDGSLVIIRQASIHYHSNADNSDSAPTPALVIFSDGSPTISLAKRQSVSLLSIKGGDGISRWYKSRFLKGMDQ